jgi:hypothetical protein
MSMTAPEAFLYDIEVKDLIEVNDISRRLVQR